MTPAVRWPRRPLGDRSLHDLGGGVGVGAAHEAGDVARDDPLALGGVVEPLAIVGQRVEGQLADTVERRLAVGSALDDVDRVAAQRRMVAQRDRDVAVEQQLGIALVA